MRLQPRPFEREKPLPTAHDICRSRKMDNPLRSGKILPVSGTIMDRIEAMRILLGVADRESFSAAARALGVPLATVSRKVDALERHLGTKLLVRTTRKVALTEAGSAYVAAARRILDEIDEAERTAAGEFQS